MNDTNLVQRRVLLKRFLGTAAGAALMPKLLSDALAQQEKPRTAMIHTLEGEVRVNDRPATVATACCVGGAVSCCAARVLQRQWCWQLCGLIN